MRNTNRRWRLDKAIGLELSRKSRPPLPLSIISRATLPVAERPDWPIITGNIEFSPRAYAPSHYIHDHLDTSFKGLPHRLLARLINDNA
jgi:hypothetical protein